ncbi:response regulator [Halorubrum sp. GN11_10-6_MGM]|uniref:response regulator n=1 Tax=Halorubrum sp. GN11_10-6_MGM TaxID=2518112 RepID=UPI0010F579E0|nr:response regulator [Halorubrum sp. GN11_10-6_MGM]TKX75806.1 response regulator [Halorubrum sp. GN11_10-6_MGM]
MTDHTTPPFDASAAANAADRNEPTADGAERDRGAQITVLQVEADERSAELLEVFAARLTDRVRVRSVERLSDALDALDAGAEIDGEEVAIDCVVTEQLLPDGRGVELTKRLREANGELPVVFHTTCPSDEGEAAAFGAGADAYFEKGADRGRFDAILNRVRALVDERRGRARGAERADAPTPRTLGSPARSLRSEE